MDSLAVLIGNAFAFRFSQHAEAAMGLRCEIAFLPRLAPTLPLDNPAIRVRRGALCHGPAISGLWRDSGRSTPSAALR
jgi:hypothetical protein